MNDFFAQFKQVAETCQSILADEFLADALFEEAEREYSSKKLVVVPSTEIFDEYDALSIVGVLDMNHFNECLQAGRIFYVINYKGEWIDTVLNAI